MGRIESLLLFLEDTPKDDFLRHALALELIKAGELQKAKKIFKNILADNPEYTGSYYHLAKLYESLGDNDTAIKWYEKGMETAKRNNDTRSYVELKSAYEELTM